VEVSQKNSHARKNFYAKSNANDRKTARNILVIENVASNVFHAIRFARNLCRVESINARHFAMMEIVIRVRLSSKLSAGVARQRFPFFAADWKKAKDQNARKRAKCRRNVIMIRCRTNATPVNAQIVVKLAANHCHANIVVSQNVTITSKSSQRIQISNQNCPAKCQKKKLLSRNCRIQIVLL
jgi:hypothetical protein